MEKGALSAKSVENIQKLKELRGSPILLIYSREPLVRSNARALEKTFRPLGAFDNIDIILDSGGGDIDAAYKIVGILKAKAKKITILIANLAKSAATLITLGADEILMSLDSELGPLDALVAHPRDPNKQISALDAFKTFEFIRDYLLESLDRAVFLMVQRGLDVGKAVENAITLVGHLCAPLYSQIDPIFMGESERTLLIAEEYGRRLLGSVKGQTSDQLVQNMVRSYPSHSFAIDINEAKKLGLNVHLLSGNELELVNNILDDIHTEEPIVYFSNIPRRRRRLVKKKRVD